MNEKLFNTYSLAVLAGLKLRGISSAELGIAIATPKSRMAKISRGSAEFSYREITGIEKLAGVTAGQLAAAATEPDGGPMTDLSNQWGKMFQMERELEHSANANGHVLTAKTRKPASSHSKYKAHRKTATATRRRKLVKV